MVEGARFELAGQLSPASGIQSRRVRPLRQPSEKRVFKIGGLDRIRTCVPLAERFFSKEVVSATHPPIQNWWLLPGSNRGPSPCKGDALPTELSNRTTNAFSWVRQGLHLQPMDAGWFKQAPQQVPPRLLTCPSPASFTGSRTPKKHSLQLTFQRDQQCW